MLEILDDIKYDETYFSSYQKEAKNKTQKQGFPHRKNQEFSYVPLKELANVRFKGKSSYAINVQSSAIEVLSMEDAIEKYSMALMNYLEKSKQKERSFFSSLSAATTKNAICLFINDSVEELIKVEESLNAHDEFCAPMIFIFAKEGARAKVHFSVKVTGKNNCVSRVVDVLAAKNANIELFESFKIEKENYFFTHVDASIKESANVSYFSGVKGCKVFRNEVKSTLYEEHASVSCSGFWKGEQSDSVHALINCTHLAPNTISKQHYQGSVNNEAIASFEGQIYIDKIAQKTDSDQLSKHLVIGEKSHGFSKPNLEVFADDVKAAHGATVSMINEDELIYLRARGIDQKTAEKLLQRSFLSFFMDSIAEESVADEFARLIHD